MYLEDVEQIINNNTKIKIKYDCCDKEYEIRLINAKTNYSKNNEKHICRSCWLKSNDNPAKRNEVKKKIKQTNIERYGNSCSMNSEKNIIKRIEKWKHKEKEIIEKRKQTNIEKYGFDHPMKNDEIKNKLQQVFIDKYGVKNPNQIDSVKEKIKKTNLRKYGVEFSSQKHISEETLEKLSNVDWLYDQNHNQKKSCVQIAQELGLSKNHISKIFNKFDIDIMKTHLSSLENEIKEYIKSFNIQTLFNDRKLIAPNELDIIVPEKKIAIEFNGLYWHSFDHMEIKNEKEKHLIKTKKCTNDGYQLYHIFENEWLDESKKDIWKSVLSSAMEKNNKIFARKCIVREIKDDKFMRCFLSDNHLQGYIGASIKLGLEYDNEIVCVMTFGKSRFNKQYKWELLRYCNKKYFNVIGGAGKLFKYFINNFNPESIISYSDLRFSSGNMYKLIGMNFLHTSPPNYYYLRSSNINLLSRINFQKHKLKGILDEFDPELSEAQNMFKNGYRRIWDCGNMVFSWSR